MRSKLKAHYKAAIELLELMSIASLTALVADAIWIVRDIIVGGFSTVLGVICVLLWTAVVLMSYGVWKYHHKQVKEILHQTMLMKAHRCKQLHKRRVL
jgi:hypothetical protein